MDQNRDEATVDEHELTLGVVTAGGNSDWLEVNAHPTIRFCRYRYVAFNSAAQISLSQASITMVLLLSLGGGRLRADTQDEYLRQENF